MKSEALRPAASAGVPGLTVLTFNNEIYERHLRAYVHGLERVNWRAKKKDDDFYLYVILGVIEIKTVMHLQDLKKYDVVCVSRINPVLQ